MIHLGKQAVTYTFSPHHPPAIKVDPGTTILFDTLDALDDQIHTDADLASKVDLNHVNAATGPVYINGANAGDTLVAEIMDIKPQDWGAALIIPGFGSLQADIPGPYTKVFHFDKDGFAQYGNSIKIPPRPMIGTIGVAPLEEITTLSSGRHGGNLDTTDIRPGSKVYFPVFVEGALFGVGDVHATMGNGEVCGTGIECGAQATIRLGLLVNYPIARPRIETKDEIMSVASAESLETAIRFALQDMVDWLAHEKQLSKEEAYVLISIAGDVRIGQIVDPAVTVRVAVPKTIFI